MARKGGREKMAGGERRLNERCHCVGTHRIAAAIERMHPLVALSRLMMCTKFVSSDTVLHCKEQPTFHVRRSFLTLSLLYLVDRYFFLSLILSFLLPRDLDEIGSADNNTVNKIRSD